jgi:hypothetical protein
MRPNVQSATDRVIAIRARLTGEPQRDVSMREREDALSEGYAEALAGDAWLASTEHRLHQLIDDVSIPVRGRDLRLLMREHDDVQRSVIALRRELAGLRREHDRLLERSHSRAS